jgi:hypothetical protein
MDAIEACYLMLQRIGVMSKGSGFVVDFEDASFVEDVATVR